MDDETGRDIRIIAWALEKRLGRKPTRAEVIDFVMAPKSVRKMFWEIPPRRRD